MREDFYEILGVNRGATQEEIKRAFKRKALDCHPDRHPDDPYAEERFKKVQEAYSVLSDPHERAYYDRTGRAGSRRRSGPFGFGFEGDPADIFEDILGQFFGTGFGARRRRARSRPRGDDLKLNIRLSFEEAVFGTEVKLKVPRNETCPACGGSGAKPGVEPTVCGMCGGAGEIHMRQGFLMFSRPCRQCGGRGRVIRQFCPECEGSGRIVEEKELTVKVPAGIKDGTRLKVAGEGDKGDYGGPRGDLFVVVNVDPHPRFSRKGNDIIVEVPVSYPQAALGAEIDVPSLDGDQRLWVPAGTQSGQVFRMRGLGAPELNGKGRGDLHVVVHVEVPTKLSHEQKELLRMLAEKEGSDVENKSRSFLGKVWDIIG